VLTTLFGYDAAFDRYRRRPTGMNFEVLPELHWALWLRVRLGDYARGGFPDAVFLLAPEGGLAAAKR